MRNESAIRAFSPEATLTLNDVDYTVGGLQQVSQSAYWNSTELDAGGLTPMDPETTFSYVSHSLSSPKAPFPWTPGTRHSPASTPWPPKGLTLSVKFECGSCSDSLVRSDVVVFVHYEMYVGVPLMSKWVSVHRGSGVPVTHHRFAELRGHNYGEKRSSIRKADPKAEAEVVVVDKVTVEWLCTTRAYSPVVFAPYPSNPPRRYVDPSTSLLHVATDQAHGAKISWVNDERQSSSPGSSQPTVMVTYGSGPGVYLEATEADFVSFRALIFVSDSIDRERSSLGRRRMVRTLAPTTLEAPLFFHLTDSSSKGLHSIVDQLQTVGGWDMIIYSFGSGFKLETNDPIYLHRIKEDIAYAHSKGLEVGGYDLICLQRGKGGYGGNVGDKWDVVLEGGKLGPDACFASGWVDKLNEYVDDFVDKTGLSMLETDGPYGGGSCASTNHSYHRGLSDSIYHQERYQGGMYGRLRQKNIFINQPDNYFYFGASKTGIGYDEDQFSLPRWQDLTVTRGSIFDDTYEKIPTMGWSFVPLVEYHGGGSAAAFSPLRLHLDAFEFALAQHIGAGVAACYRGSQIFDDDKSEFLAKKWATFWVNYRSLLTKDIIHLRRVDGRGIDAFMHVDPTANDRALVMAFNSQTTKTERTNLKVPLYYAGLSEIAFVRQEGSEPVRKMTLARDYSIVLGVDLPAQTVTWWIVSLS